MKKERKYRRMTWTDRLKIEALYNAGHSYRFIAHEVGFTPAAVHREVKHGLYNHLDGDTWCYVKRYSATIAQEYAEQQATSKGIPIKLGKRYDYASYVAAEIFAGKSPDIIVHELRKQGSWTVSTTTLYRYIDAGYIPGVTSANLLEKSRRKSHKKKVRPAARPPKGISIERRPSEISSRHIFGHWEMDTVIGKAKGKKQAVLVLTERKTRFEIIVRLWDKSCKSVVCALDNTLSKYPSGTFKTITVDNGSEFQDCYGMEYDKEGNKRLQIYYCHPFCSSERGSNERANRIIRRFFPKGQSFAKYTSKDCQNVMNWMNNYPRKILDYSTPAELFQTELQKIVL